jgi:hypothetical protein
MKDEPTTGSPPMPTIVEFPRPSCVSSWPIWYVSVPERETRPIAPSEKISAGIQLGSTQSELAQLVAERYGARA